uniref:Uncharacterized protein n=1 Tax=Oxyrrhis marina TaxID=2969 RepID=A0A7S4LQ19_OXYMA|mmetsp:Transcript_43793/g.115753  ORF Transcript_43793/g.115753 Transcript_43793/m.115753 type:complete len:225 (-) Transcript_43793:464-1138(-)
MGQSSSLEAVRSPCESINGPCLARPSVEGEPINVVAAMWHRFAGVESGVSDSEEESMDEKASAEQLRSLERCLEEHCLLNPALETGVGTFTDEQLMRHGAFLREGRVAGLGSEPLPLDSVEEADEAQDGDDEASVPSGSPVRCTAKPVSPSGVRQVSEALCEVNVSLEPRQSNAKKASKPRSPKNQRNDVVLWDVTDSSLSRDFEHGSMWGRGGFAAEPVAGQV